jgi:formylmethanofuran dehydrogenase subunit C
MQRLDLSPLVPHLLAGSSNKDIASIDIGTTREKISVGDLFKITGTSGEEIHFEGGSERFDRIGHAMRGGQIIVEGEVGVEAGRLMESGNIVIRGDAGAYAGSGMSGGRLEIVGNAGDFLGSAREGEVNGMSRGFIFVRGSAGARAGDRLRRGTIVVEKHAGDWPGSRMIAGTLIVLGQSGINPGYLMRRGTILLGKASPLPATFVDSGVFDSSFTRLFSRLLRPESRNTAKLFNQPLQRFAGDMAVLGKGEILTPP